MGNVIVVRKVRAEKAGKPDRNYYKALLESGLYKLSRHLDKESTPRNYAGIVVPGKVIGMKTNCLARKFNSTSPALTEALGDILAKAGVRDNDIIIWDRSSAELEMAGYKLNASSFGRRCMGTDSNGLGYSKEFFTSGRVNSLLSRILTDMVDSNINLPVLKDHSIAGLSGGLKNMYGAINNPNKYHDNNCSPFAAHVSALEPIKAKNRLTIIDAVTIQYNMGPGFDSRYIDAYDGLIISADPVAADIVALRVLNHFRQIHNLPDLKDAGRPVLYLDEAKAIGLGGSGEIEIDVIDIDNRGNETKGRLF
jgi:uncharacterized protein (DUF362 family)